MSWIILAISAHFFWALTNLGDKYVIGNKVRNPYVYLVFVTFLGILVALAIPWTGFYIPDTQTMVFLFGAGAVYFFGCMPYIKAMQMEEPTRINVWWNLIPLFAFGLGWILFRQTLSGRELIGFFILISSAFIATIHVGKKNFSFSKAVWLMLVACFAFALYAVLLDQVLDTMPFVVAYIWIHIVMFVCAFVLFLSRQFRQDFSQSVQSLDKKLFFTIFAVAIVDHLGILFNQWALVTGQASLVFVFEGIQVIFVFIMATLLSLFLPHIIKEDLSRKNVLLKIGAILLMLLGVVVLGMN